MMNVLPWKRAAGAGNGTTALSPVSRLRWDMDRVFDRFFDDAWSLDGFEPDQLRIELYESDEAIRITAEVPGIDPGDLDISLQGQVLTLSGEKKVQAEGERENRTYSERRYGAFRRAIQLPCPVEVDDVQAEHRNGIVTITLRKSEAVRPKRIAIRSS